MNVKKILIGLACVLAVTVAAQPARAQFLSFAEREALRNTLTVWQEAKAAEEKQKQNQQKQGQTLSSPKQPVPAEQADSQKFYPYMAGREMKMVYSAEYLKDAACKCWQGVCKVGRACGRALHEAAINSVKYGPGGSEGAAMRAGELLEQKFFRSSKKSVGINDTKAQNKNKQDSLSKALEQANIKAIKELQNK